MDAEGYYLSMSNGCHHGRYCNLNQRIDLMKEELNKAIDMIDGGYRSMGIEHELETLDRMARELLHYEFNKEDESYE
jgi:hypothetical protein